MARIINQKELINTKLATNYGGWIYCESCNENIGYLCYSTYDELILKYTCICKNQGKVFLNFKDSNPGNKENKNLIIIKNRFCCANDNNPLITLIDKKLINYEFQITCKSCSSIYHKNKEK